MSDIQFLDNETIRFQKLLWHPSEETLAKCFNFTQDIDNGFIDCHIPSVSDRAIFEFVKLGFKSFNESSAEAGRREMFYDRLAGIRHELNRNVDELMQKRLPYYEMLYAHQRDVLYESYHKRDNYLAMEMGTGKTITAASLSRIHNIPRTLILAPAAVKFNWWRDLKKFGFNELYFSILDSKRKRTIHAFEERFVIVNYDIIGKFMDHILSSDIGHIICDEAHLLKNHLSNRGKGIKFIFDSFPNAYKTFLSGSPIKNRVNDVYAYLKYIDHELGKNHKKFLEQYTIRTTGRGGERVTGGRNLEDLRIKLSNFMIRKTKDECLDLPDKVYHEYFYELDDYRTEYNKVIEELSKIKDINSLTGNIHSLNIIVSKAKTQGIIEIANTIIDEGRKVVIFGGYKEPMSDLEKHFGRACVKVDGSVDSFQRDQNVQRFIQDPECLVFLGNWIAGGVGINLVNACDIIVHNFPLTPADLYQGIDRLHRIGQAQSVNVHYTFCQGSIDEHLYELILDKEMDANMVLDEGKEVVLREDMVQILVKKLLGNVETTEKITVSEKEEAVTESVQGNNEEDKTAGLPAKPERKSAVITDEQVEKNFEHINKVRSKFYPDQFSSENPGYHLIVHAESGCCFVLNQKQYDEFVSDGCAEWHSSYGSLEKAIEEGINMKDLVFDDTNIPELNEKKIDVATSKFPSRPTFK